MFPIYKYLLAVSAALAAVGCTTTDSGTVRTCDAPVAKYTQLCSSTPAEQKFVMNSCTTSMSDDSYQCWIACVNSAKSCFDAQHCCQQ